MNYTNAIVTIEYVEPDSNGNVIVKRVNIREAIQIQKDIAMKSKGYLYNNSIDACLDYLIGHWGTIFVNGVSTNDNTDIIKLVEDIVRDIE